MKLLLLLALSVFASDKQETFEGNSKSAIRNPLTYNDEIYFDFEEADYHMLNGETTNNIREFYRGEQFRELQSKRTIKSSTKMGNKLKPGVLFIGWGNVPRFPSDEIHFLKFANLGDYLDYYSNPEKYLTVDMYGRLEPDVMGNICDKSTWEKIEKYKEFEKVIFENVDFEIYIEVPEKYKLLDRVIRNPKHVLDCFKLVNQKVFDVLKTGGKVVYIGAYDPKVAKYGVHTTKIRYNSAKRTEEIEKELYDSILGKQIATGTLVLEKYEH